MRARALALAVLVLGAALGALGTASPPARALTVQLLGFNLTDVKLPGFVNLSAYTYNYAGQYPTVGFAGQCSAGILYLNSASKLACFAPGNGTAWNVSGAVTLLYQKTAGLQAQIDNEFQLDTPYDVALLYGNLTTSPGAVTVETVNLTTGAIHQATSPVQMGNSIQADYVGGGNVVIFNDSGSVGQPTYFTNVLNGTSWPAGLSVGFAPNNIYWVGQLRSFLDVQGLRITQLQVAGGSLVVGPSVYFNNSGISSVSAVDGLQFQGGSSRLAVVLATNLGGYVERAKISGGLLVQSGSTAYLTARAAYVQRYSYTSNYLWSVQAGQTLLWDPIDNLTVGTPNVVGRQASTGANGNFEFTNPYSSAVYLSLNVSLIGLSSRAANEYVWATQIPPTSITFPVSAGPAPSGIPAWIFFVLTAAGALLIVAAVWGSDGKPR